MSWVTSEVTDLFDDLPTTSLPIGPQAPVPELILPEPIAHVEEFEYEEHHEYQDEDYQEYHEPTTPPLSDSAAILDSTSAYNRRYFPEPLNTDGDRYLLHKPSKQSNTAKFAVGDSTFNMIVS
jgi:hypothetical protein